MSAPSDAFVAPPVRSEPPTFDAEAVAAAQASAAERASDLPPELRFADAKIEQLVQVASRRAAARVPRPAEPDADARLRCTAALRDLQACMAQAPSAELVAQLEALSSANSREWTLGTVAASARTYDADNDAEEASLARVVVALAAHCAAPDAFARYAQQSGARSAACGAAGIAAASLCCADEHRACRLFAAGGASVLASVAGWDSAPLRVRAAAVRALALATRFASACAVLAEELPSSSTGGARASESDTLSCFTRLLLTPLPPLSGIAGWVKAALCRIYVCSLCWRLRAAATADDAGEMAADVTHALAALFAQNRPEVTLLPENSSAMTPYDVPIVSLLLDTRALSSLALAVGRAGHACTSLRDGATALLSELMFSPAGLYAIALNAASCASLAKALGAEVEALIHAALLGVAGVEALLHGEQDAVRLGALHSLVRLVRDGAHVQRATLLLASAPGAIDQLVGALSVHTPPESPVLLSSLALELLTALVSDAQTACLAAWTPHASRLLQAVSASESKRPPAAASTARDWLLAGVRWQERGCDGLMSWLAMFVAQGSSAAGVQPGGEGAPAVPQAGDVKGGPAAGSSPAAGAAAGHIGVLLTLRLLRASASASADVAAALFAADAVGVAALLLRRAAEVLVRCGVAAPDDAAALDEDADVGQVLGAVRRCVRAADLCAATASLLQTLLEALRAGGVAEYRSCALVKSLRDAHAAASVLDAGGGPVAGASHTARTTCAACLAYWVTGPPAWQPRALPLLAGEGPVPPRATLASALAIHDVLPPGGQQLRLEPDVLERLQSDLQPGALQALLLNALASPSARLQAAAVCTLARAALLAPSCVASACAQSVAACADDEPVRSRLMHALSLLAGDADVSDSGAFEASLVARLSGAADASDCGSTVLAEHRSFPAALEEALTCSDSSLATWRVSREGMRAAEEAAKRMRIARAEARAKRTKASDGAPSAPEPPPLPLPAKRKPGGAGGASRTIHVDEFEARQAAARKGALPVDEPQPPLAPPPPPVVAAPAPPPPTQQAVAAPPPPKSMLSIRLGAGAAAAQPLAQPVPAAAAVAVPSEPPQPVAEALGAPVDRVLPAQQPEMPVIAAAPPVHAPAPPPAPALAAGPALIPGLGLAFGAPAPTIPGLAFSAVAAPPPTHAVMQPTAPVQQQLYAASGCQEPPVAVQGPPQQLTSAQQQAALLQSLSSPEAITALLNDPPRLRALLEQFPALASMLQARLRGGAQQ